MTEQPASTPEPRFRPYRFTEDKPLRASGVKVIIGNQYLHIPYHHAAAVADGLIDALEQETNG